VADAALVHRALLACLVAGLAFSAYAALEAANPTLTDVCSVNGYVSCGKVLGSGHTTFPPGSSFPDWAWGVGGFVAMLALDIPLLRTYDKRLLVAVFALALVGLGMAAVFGYIEVAVIGALCPVCIGAYLSDLGAVVSAGVLLRLRAATDAEAAGARAPAPPPPRPALAAED
jgi:uncharacterized membrane protein